MSEKIILKPIRTMERVIRLARNGRAIYFGKYARTNAAVRCPAAFVQNWYASYLFRQIEQGRLYEQVKEKQPRKGQAASQ